MEDAPSRRARRESKMSKYQARESLGGIIEQKTGGTTKPQADEQIVTLGWFTRNRFFPLNEGAAWRETTAMNRKADIENDILAKFGDMEMKVIDKVMLQTHLNELARTLSAGRVAHARSYLKAIFEEAIEQDFVEKNPARKLILPKELRAVDKTVLTWIAPDGAGVGSAPRSHPAYAGHDGDVSAERIVRTPWIGFDMDARMLTVTQTAYRARYATSARPEIVADGAPPEGWRTSCGCGSRSAPIPRPKRSSFQMRTSAMGRKKTASSAPTIIAPAC